MSSAKRSRLPRLQHTKPLIVPLVGATVFSIVVAFGWQDLGLNLVADCAALWFGLFVVEVAVTKGRAEADKPAHRAMVDDLLRLREPINHILFLLLLETATMADAEVLRAAHRGEVDVAMILTRRKLTSSLAPMRQLGVLGGPQLTWQQVVWTYLSPQALRPETLIARYIAVADSPTLAALQGLETCFFMDTIRGRFPFDDDIVLEIFWRSLIQSLAALDKELGLALDQHEDRGAILGHAPYAEMALGFIERRETPTA